MKTDLATNIEDKREKAISNLLKKEDLGLIQMRLRENIKILSNFRELRDPDRSRVSYLDEIKEDVSRTNTLKTKRKDLAKVLIQRGV